MRESSKTALGGIVAALAVVIMLITYISPLLVYTAPPFAGILLIIIIKEIGRKWAFGTYAAISVLSMLFIADKEAAVFFVFFFGYYPILRDILTRKIRKKAVLIALKMLIFNLALLSAVFVCAYVFNIDYSEFSDSGTAMLVLFWVLMNVVFVTYDFLLSRILILYDIRIKKEFARLFHH